MSGDKPRFARAPRRGIPSTSVERLQMVERLRAHDGFQSLKPSVKYVIATTVERRADATGRFWEKTRLIAKEIGVSRSTVVRALSAGVAAGVLTREPYLRPDGLQGTTTYYLAPEIVDRQGASTVTQLVPEDERQGESTLTQRQGESTLSHLNGSELGEPLIEEEREVVQGRNEGESALAKTERILSMLDENATGRADAEMQEAVRQARAAQLFAASNSGPDWA